MRAEFQENQIQWRQRWRQKIAVLTVLLNAIVFIFRWTSLRKLKGISYSSSIAQHLFRKFKLNMLKNNWNLSFCPLSCFSWSPARKYTYTTEVVETDERWLTLNVLLRNTRVFKGRNVRIQGPSFYTCIFIFVSCMIWYLITLHTSIVTVICVFIDNRPIYILIIHLLLTYPCQWRNNTALQI